MAYSVLRGGAGARADVRPSNPGYPYRYNSGRGGGADVFGASRKFAQGAGAALLMAAGAGSVAGATEAGVAPPVVDFTTLDGLAETLATGGFTGPLQIIGAILIFLAAGRCVARFAGLAIMVALMFAYAQGVTLSDALAFSGGFMERLIAAINAFRAT